MSPFFALFFVLMLGSSAYAAGRLHGQLSYRIGYRFGYRQGFLDGGRAEGKHALKRARAAAAAHGEQVEAAERRGYATAVGDFRAGGGDAELAAARGQGYALAVARLRDDSRYTHWWTAREYEPDERYWAPEAREHLAAYLETVERWSDEPLVGGGGR